MCNTTCKYWVHCTDTNRDKNESGFYLMKFVKLVNYVSKTTFVDVRLLYLLVTFNLCGKPLLKVESKMKQ